MSTEAFGSWLIANARIAPTAIRSRLTGKPIGALCPLGVQKERPRDSGVVAAPALASGRVFLQCPRRESRPRDGRDDLPEAARALVEVALPPVHQSVHAERDRVLLEEQEVAALFERRGDVARPGVQIADLRKGAEARVDEVEAPAPKLSRKRLRLRLHPEDGRPPLARRLERLAGGVDPGDDG